MSVDAVVEWPNFLQIPEEDSLNVPRPKGQALSPYIWWNGEIKAAHEQSIHYYANALHYGTAVFEGVRCYPTESGAALFRLRDHMERLLGSARLYGMKVPFTADQLCRGALDVTRKNGVANAYIRPLAFFGYGPIDITPKKECSVNVFIATRELGYFLGEKALRNGARLMVSSWRKFPHACMPTMAKASGHYANSVLAAHEAFDHGFDDAILLNQDGSVSSTTGGNLFFVRGATLFTNDTNSAIVPGITRDSVLTLAADAGVQVSVRSFAREELLRADEVFMTGTAAEVTPVREIDGIEFRTGKSTLAAQLQRAYMATVTGRNPKHVAWLSAVERG
jgi:branched-chain amino acid aminotransferase